MPTFFLIGCMLFFTLFLAGCDRINTVFNQNISKPKPEPTAELPTTLHRQVNGEFIKELFLNVLERSSKEDEFNKFMNVLDQGGHYDAIYNGLVYSEEYRSKEKNIASVGALKLYAEIMAELTLFQKYDSQKFLQKDKPDVPTPNNIDERIQLPTASEAERTALIAELEQEALSKSNYTLKKRVGEEVLKTIEIKKEYREKLATWYGRFTIFLNKKGQDFGLAQRNNLNEYYHYQWALKADEERLKWECLNRVHLLFNQKK